MPYAKSLQAYTPAEFYAAAPESWERRLREISPDLPNIDRLVFRYFAPTNPDGSDRGWHCSEQGQWVLYTAKPIRMVTAERALQFEKHWSELHSTEQEGRKAVVSDYQHFMWHSQGLYVNAFLILQGPWGGTPAKYTEKEIAYLSASGLLDEPFPIGCFPACPFDERTVKMISMRDRLLQQSGDYDAVQKMDSPLAMLQDTEEAQKHKRAVYLDTWREIMRPSVEFMQSSKGKSFASQDLPPAPEGTSAAVAQWKDHYIEFGSMIGAKAAGQRRVQMAVQ